MTKHYNIVIAGGGINGVGVAQAAACAGYSVLLLEKTAIASGTSSKSSKLIHGGLRYLESFNLKLVRESLKEREILLNIAPHLVQLIPFHIPVYRNTSRSQITLRSGLSLYALLGGLKKDNLFSTVPKSDWGKLDGINISQLQNVFKYYDAQTNDALLTQSVMQSAINFGAKCLYPAELVAVKTSSSQCEVTYQVSGKKKYCSANVFINAGGPWANSIDNLIMPKPKKVNVDLVQGSHLILDQAVQSGAYYLEAPQDSRAVFLLPWGKQSLLGTTEHKYTGNPNNVTILKEEEDYLLNIYQHYFPNNHSKVIGKFTGLRVLPSSTGSIFSSSRETQLIVDNDYQPKRLSIYGGKLTSYRATAQKVMDKISSSLVNKKNLADTAKLKLPQTG